MSSIISHFGTLAREDRAIIGSSATLPEHRGGIPVSVRGLGKSFGPTPVLSNVDLDIAPGEFLAIVGHSGCGKSTLLRLIAGLETPTSGAIEINGRRIEGQASEARLLFQDARLLPWRRVLDNAAISLRGPGRRETALAALERVGLAAKADLWPATLSGGQRQRVALARALVSRPRLLLLDEPLGALDALTRLEMQDLIEQVWRSQGFTTILVTHDVSEAVRLADRVVVLDHGRIAEIWPIRQPRPRDRAVQGEIESAILTRLMHRTH